jgi:hypothetical protein
LLFGELWGFITGFLGILEGGEKSVMLAHVKEIMLIQIFGEILRSIEVVIYKEFMKNMIFIDKREKLLFDEYGESLFSFGLIFGS